jgi:hypothetical protein
MNETLLLALLHMTAVGNQGRLTLTDPVGIVRPFVAVSATRWDAEVEVLMRAGLTTAGPVRVSAGVLATDIEGDDTGMRCGAMEFTADL